MKGWRDENIARYNTIFSTSNFLIYRNLPSFVFRCSFPEGKERGGSSKISPKIGGGWKFEIWDDILLEEWGVWRPCSPLSWYTCVISPRLTISSNVPGRSTIIIIDGRYIFIRGLGACIKTVPGAHGRVGVNLSIRLHQTDIFDSGERIHPIRNDKLAAVLLYNL